MTEKELVTIALQLVRDHYDGDDTRFDESCKELEQWCFDHSKEELGEFAWACRCPACNFVPMESEARDE